MDIAYLQCDFRFNKWLLEIIGGEYAIEYTIKRAKKLKCEKIIAGIYQCKENDLLVEILSKNGIEVVLSEDCDANSRFINLMTAEKKTDFVVRIGGDQVLFDVERTNMILAEMHKEKSEWFMGGTSACIIPDIVSIDCLKKYKRKMLEKERYFHTFENNITVRRYKTPYPCSMLYDFRINSYEHFRSCKKIIEKQLDVYDLVERLAVSLRNKDNYLNRSGIWGSWILPTTEMDFFYDEEQKVNPWWASSVVDFVKKKLNNNMAVFEWGSGNSSLFFAQYVKKVVSIEHNFEWYERMKKEVPSNVKVKFFELEYGGAYSSAILDEVDKFDIILIDGRDRVHCAINAVDKLSKGGIIIWDNTDRECYRKAYDYLIECGFKQLELSSIIYGLPGIEDFTSIFYKENNILGL